MESHSFHVFSLDLKKMIYSPILHPTTSVEWFDPGYSNTWYMKDEDNDGRDDYCRYFNILNCLYFLHSLSRVTLTFTIENFAIFAV